MTFTPTGMSQNEIKALVSFCDTPIIFCIERAANILKEKLP